MITATYGEYAPRSIINTAKRPDSGWFWTRYSATPYSGCEWGCSYCYCRDEKYSPYKPGRNPEATAFADPFSECIRAKLAAPAMLRKALGKKPRDIIYLHGYQPIDRKYRYMRAMLEVCRDLGFPVFLNEKSPLLLHDLDVLEQVDAAQHLNVGWSLITTDDAVRQAFEPHAPPVSARLEAMARLAERGIETGTVFMPILPFIADNAEAIEALVAATKEHGGRYVLDGGLTLWAQCGVHFYQRLNEVRPDLVPQYQALYADWRAVSARSAHGHRLVVETCRRHGLTLYIPRYRGHYPQKLQLNKRIAAALHLQAREWSLSGQGGHREWAYRKAGWALDEMTESVADLYRREGASSLLKIDGVGKSLATSIEAFLQEQEAAAAGPDREEGATCRGESN